MNQPISPAASDSTRERRAVAFAIFAARGGKKRDCLLAQKPRLFFIDTRVSLNRSRADVLMTGARQTTAAPGFLFDPKFADAGGPDTAQTLAGVNVGTAPDT